MKNLKNLGFILTLLVLTTNCVGQSLKVRPTLNGVKGTNITLQQISDLEELELIGPDSVRIVSFRLVVSPRKGNPKMASNNGAKLSVTCSQWINQLQVGDRILFDKIMVKTPSGETKKVLTKIYDVQAGSGEDD